MKEKELCRKCGGNGVLRIPGGVSRCDRCEGDCWDPERSPLGVIVQGFEQLLPAHAASLHLTHNEHKGVYENAEEWLREYDDSDFIAPGERERCIAADSVWQLQWYPKTPVGFRLLIAASLTDLMASVLAP